MNIFLYEFFHFLAVSLAILVSLSSFALFIITFRYERKLQTVWRALGFLLLAFAFLLLIWETKEPAMDFIAVVVQAFALFSIFWGVAKEPKLVHLIKVTPKGVIRNLVSQKGKLIENRTLLGLVVLVLLVIALLVPFYVFLGEYVPPVIEFLATVFIFATIIIQIRRYRADKAPVNLYPLLGYIFLLVRGICMVFYRLPDLNILFLRKMTLEYSVVWQIAVFCTFMAFVFLGIWAWSFVRVRKFLRIYVVFIALVVLVATVGALVFSLFVFQLIERNNLDLMLKGADTHSVIMEDKANSAMFVATLISGDNTVIQAVKNNNYQALVESTQRYLESADVDVLRIFNSYGEILASPSDPRDRGRVLSDDSLLAFALEERKQVRDFGTYPSTMADVVVARAIYPLILEGEVIGAVEVGYKFDNAFVDFSKKKTNLDITIYTGTKISATTIKTADQVSRYIGAEEVREDVIDAVLSRGESYTTTINRFGEIYYTAYTPIRNINGQIIGAVSVGTPTYLLLESVRQVLLTTFIIVTLLSALISLVGYYTMTSLRTGGGENAP